MKWLYFEKETRPATYRALTDVNLLIVDKKTFLRRIHQDPWFVLRSNAKNVNDVLVP